ncbi:CDP-2,3-bis-(O-geranylgeranyl)-sn-glycerol synthase [Tamilnaduibacter salinus]|uniref:CDP-2,3-bis-(O-geranylgeranyl)-sn-glycerol synthase n=1 Tax=Tamilnaduibacter salinus TaxID=1484056 RepID=A0A2U1CWF8_9GAMM|nr:CDP-archaeol synthase [Tamilnaduibacter salinus]PVY75978.1 CDP-2,3-bis-(O-geranylgeranyl)-sn-glycerol synthase [Tamilnaduibacter salinus]
MILTLLLILLAANGAPVLLRSLIGRRGASPVDGGRLAWDGRPWLGASKTWRGLLAGILLAAVVAWLLGPGALFGAVLGGLAMAGDLFSSFVKRRLGKASSDRVTGLDQIPESLLPALAAGVWLALAVWQVLAVVLLFMLADMVGSPLLYRLGLRRHPH